MNSRQRFLETMRGGNPDRLPLFPEGIRDEVLQAWRLQGLPPEARLQDLFHYDEFEELAPEIYPLPGIGDWANPKAVLRQLRTRLNPDDRRRLPEGWTRRVTEWKERQHALFLRIHQGLFLSLGVEGWNGFSRAIQLLVDEPAFVAKVLATQAHFAARLAANILQEVEVDAVIFSEPIAGNHGSLISPRMYRELVLASYEPVFEVLERFQVPVVIWRSYANPRALIPEVACSRFTAVWPCEAPPGTMDFADLRRELGPAMGLIGGIDADVLYQGRESIRKAIQATLPLVKQGRFIPLADGRVREDVPYEHYAYYRKIIQELF